MQHQACTVAPVSEDDDNGCDKEPAAAATQPDDTEEAGPCSMTPTSSRLSRFRKEKTQSTMDKAIMSMVRQMKEIGAEKECQRHAGGGEEPQEGLRLVVLI